MVSQSQWNPFEKTCHIPGVVQFQWSVSDEAPRQEGLTVAISWNLSWNCDRKISCKPALDETDGKGMDCHQRHLLLCMQRNPIIRLNEFHGGSNVLIPLPSVRDPPSPVSKSALRSGRFTMCYHLHALWKVGKREQYETNGSTSGIQRPSKTWNGSLQFPAL